MSDAAHGLVQPGRRRRIGGGLALILAAALLAGCTHGTDGDGTSSAAPATTGGRVTDSGAAGGSVTATGSGGTGRATATAGAPGPVVVTTAVGTVTTVITAASADGPLGAVQTHPVGSADAAAAALLPGLYGLSSLGATVRGSTVEIASQGGCGFVREVIASGQWAVKPVLSPHDGVAVYVDVLTRGDSNGLLSLTESAGRCTGRITAGTAQPLTVTGTMSATGPARAVTVACVAAAEEDGVPPAHLVVVSYRTADAALLTMATVPDAVGTHQVDPDDQVVVAQYDPRKPALAQAVRTATAFFDPSAITAEASLPGVDEQHGWFQGEGAAVTVTSSDPLSGTLRAPHLARESGGGSAALSAGFRC